MYFGGYGMPYPSTPFEQNYRCYSASFIDKPHLENGDKGMLEESGFELAREGRLIVRVPRMAVDAYVGHITVLTIVASSYIAVIVVMPPSALDRLASLRIDYPMLFEVHNPSTLRTSHCGVLEFVAEEGMIYMPYWMMQNMLLQEGDIVRVKSATLPKGTFVKLQPHTKDFLDISNPKAVLETTLRNFSCLTAGDNIMVAYNNKKYYIDIIESKPANAISIIETDCEVDFAPPLDYKEPERVTPPPVPVLAPSSSQDTAPPEPEEPKFNAFTGTGRRLDGKPGSQFTNSIPATTTSPIVPSAITASAQRPTGTPPAGAQRPSGKLVFGGGSSNGAGIAAAQISSAKKKEIKEEMKEPEGPKFQAFSGRKYSLRD